MSCCIVHKRFMCFIIGAVLKTNPSSSSNDLPSRYRASVVAMIPSIRLLDRTPIALPWRARVAAEISRCVKSYVSFASSFAECVLSQAKLLNQGICLWCTIFGMHKASSDDAIVRNLACLKFASIGRSLPCCVIPVFYGVPSFASWITSLLSTNHSPRIPLSKHVCAKHKTITAHGKHEPRLKTESHLNDDSIPQEQRNRAIATNHTN